MAKSSHESLISIPLPITHSHCCSRSPFSHPRLTRRTRAAHTHTPAQLGCVLGCRVRLMTGQTRSHVDLSLSRLEVSSRTPMAKSSRESLISTLTIHSQCRSQSRSSNPRVTGRAATALGHHTLHDKWGVDLAAESV